MQAYGTAQIFYRFIPFTKSSNIGLYESINLRDFFQKQQEILM